MTVKEYMETTYEDDRYRVRQPIVCNDGFTVSVQGGTEFHCCRPRMLCNEYKNLELGYPSEIENTIIEYAEEKNNPLNTVYAYVPIEVVEKIIAKHGGIKNA